MSGLPMPQAQSDGPRLRHKMLPCASSARAKCARAPRNASCAATDKASCCTNCCRGRRIGRRPWKTPEGWGCRKLCGLKPGPAASDYWRCCTLADMAADLYANGAAGAMMGEVDQRYIVASATPSDREEHHWGILVMTFPYLAGMDHKVPHGVPERMVHRVANSKEFDSAQAGGLVRNLPIEGVRITDRGAGVVERHILRFQSEDANNFMIERLRRIAQISPKPTERDLNYHMHELREYVRYRHLGEGIWRPKGFNGSSQIMEQYACSHTKGL